MISHTQNIQSIICDTCKNHVIYLNENTIFAERAKKCEKQVYIKELISNTYENLNYDNGLIHVMLPYQILHSAK